MNKRQTKLAFAKVNLEVFLEPPILHCYEQGERRMGMNSPLRGQVK